MGTRRTAWRTSSRRINTTWRHSRLAAGEHCVSLRKKRFGPLVEDDEEDEEAPCEEELSHEKLAAPPRLEWRTITPKRKKNAKMMEVNTVTNEKGEDLWITVVSGASENVISDWMAPQFKVKPSTGSRNGVQYVAANGNMMPNRGEKDVKMTTEEGHRCVLKMQVTDVQKPLMSVARICDAGHKVTFTDAGGIIEHEATGQRTKFERVDNVYRLKVGVAEEKSVFRWQGMSALKLSRSSL